MILFATANFTSQGFPCTDSGSLARANGARCLLIGQRPLAHSRQQLVCKRLCLLELTQRDGGPGPESFPNAHAESTPSCYQGLWTKALPTSPLADSKLTFFGRAHASRTPVALALWLARTTADSYVIASRRPQALGPADRRLSTKSQPAAGLRRLGALADGALRPLTAKSGLTASRLARLVREVRFKA